MRSKGLGLGGATAAGFGLAYFFDHQSGARRRNSLRDKLASKTRGGAGDVARSVGAQASALAQKAAAAARKQDVPPNDETLKDKVQSEVLGPANVPTGKVNVDVSDGIVALRGEVGDRTTRQELDVKVRRIEGVREVQNLLHLPGEPAPNLTPVSGTG